MSDRYEVTGHSALGLETTTSMPVSERLGREMSRAYAPANGAVGKLNATCPGINFTFGGANEANRHLRWNQLIQDPIDARIKTDAGVGAVGPGDIELLAPGEWTIETDVRFDWTAYTGDDACEVIVTVRDKTGAIIRQKSVGLPLGTSWGTISCRISDALILPEHLPATVDVWFKTGRWRGIWGGAKYTDISVKKTTRYADSTEFTESDTNNVGNA